MARRIRLNIRAKLLALALILAWLPLLGASWLGLASLDRARDSAVETATRSLRDQAESNLAKRAADKAELYNSILDHVEEEVAGVANYAQKLIAAGPAPVGGDTPVWVVPGGPSRDNERAHFETVARARQFVPLLQSVVERDDLISLGYVAFEDGGVVAFDHNIIDKLDASFDPRQRPWYTASRDSKGTVWVDTYVDANTGQLVTTCATPIFDQAGALVGVVGFDLLLETIQQDILKLDLGQHGYAFLLSGKGEVLVGPNMQTNGVQWNQSFAGENWFQADDPRIRSMARRMTSGEEGIHRLRSDQGEIYLAYAPMEYAGWSVGMVIPESEVTNAAAAIGTSIEERQIALRRQVYLVMALSLIALPVAGVALTYLVTRPLHRLQHGAQRIAAGDLNHQIPVESNDEIGDLVRSFNSMSVALRQKVDELEDNLRRLATLNEISNRFKTIISLPQLIEMIPRAVCDDLGFDRAALYLINGKSLRCVAAAFGEGKEAEARAFIRAANSEPIALDSATVEADVMRSGQAIIIDDPWQHPRVVQGKQQVSRSEAYVQVPIFGHEEKIIGLLSADYFYRHEAVTARDAAQLLTYASVVGLTIENTRLYTQLEQQVARRTTELRAALARAQEADKLKGKFLATISHELRTPLNAIIGFSTVMLDELDGPVTAMQREDLKTINQNGRFLLHLINELLDLSRIEANKLDLQLETFNVGMLVEEVAETVQGLIRNKPIHILTALPDQPVCAHADRAKTRQIMLNLLSNAVKFTTEGHVTIAVRPMIIAAERAEDSQESNGRAFLAISVRDTGIGIASEHLPVIFEEFRQVHAGRTGVRGSGLGLAITRKLVELLGGRIWVESTPGEGSVFTFTLPITVADIPPEPLHVPEHTESAVY